MKSKNALLSSLEESFMEMLQSTARAELEKGKKSLSEIEAEIFDSIEPAMLQRLPEQVLRHLMLHAPNMLREHRVADRGFERRNFKRWREPFDALETMVAIASEIGEACDIEGRDLAKAEDDYQFEALSQLFPRAILVVREIIHLLKGGFPDAALSRWRSLHELTVTAMFIAQCDRIVALRYLANFDFQARRAAKQYNAYSERAKLKPFSTQELEGLDRRCSIALEAVGEELKNEWDWAKPGLSQVKPNFAEVEKAVQMDHWRPRYKWASQHIHSGHRPSDNVLGASEARKPVMLVGRSNSGFVDPLHMTAISLMQITSTVLLKEPNIDRVVYAKILANLSDSVAQLAVEVQLKERPDEV